MTEFEVKFECKNCKNWWYRKFNKGTRVAENLTMIEIRVYGEDRFRCVRCPVCGIGKDVVIKNRKPLDGGGQDG